MSGFIDPQESEHRRLDRLDVLIDEALRHIGLDALSPEARAIYDDLNSVDAARVARARAALRADMDGDKL
jgi:hypothetical protein